MKYKINKSTINQKYNGKITIFDDDKSVIYRFNEVASLTFEMLKKGKTEEQITIFIQKKFNVDKKIIKQDVNVFLGELKKNKIISSLRPKK